VAAGFGVGPAGGAELRHWWLAASGGISEVEVVGHDRSELVTAVLEQGGWALADVAGGQNDDTRVWALRGGYRFSRWLGLELSYWDLGETAGAFMARAPSSQAVELVGGIDSGYRALAAAAVVSWSPLRWLTLAGTAGAHRWEHRFELNGSAAGDSISGDLREAGYGGLWGLGLELGVPAGLFFDFYWQRFYHIESEAGIDAKAVGLGWRF
jgi:hypothetical protein